MNTIKQRIEAILAQPMSRQQFLKTSGVLVLAMLGVNNVLKIFGQPQASGGQAYGASTYAGGSKPVNLG